MNVYATDKGIIEQISSGDKGWHVIIKHGDRIFSHSGHLEDPSEYIQVGDFVEGGQQIGRIQPGEEPGLGTCYFLSFNLTEGKLGPLVDPFKYGIADLCGLEPIKK